jgi:hypothetical protein
MKLVRYSGVDIPFLIHMHLGPADVYLLSREEMEAIPLVGSVPRELFRPLKDIDGPLIINTTEGEINVVEKAQHWLQSPFLIRRICPLTLLPKYLGVSAYTNSSTRNSTTKLIIQNVDPFWLDGFLHGGSL